MNIYALYLRNKFWIKDFFNGSPIGKPYKEIKFLSEQSYEKGRAIREKKLQDILSYARTYCKFYHKVKTNDLSSFPVMNKNLYLQNYDLIRVPDEQIPGQKGKVHIPTTSGSTGTPFAIPQDTRKRERRIAELKYFGKIVGFKSHETLIHLRTWNKWQTKTTKQIKSENIIPFDISQMDTNRMQDLCNLIIEKKALCLRGYASSFELLSKYVEEHPKKFPSLKICIAGSEALHEDVRASVKRNLNCEIISQYANEECGIMAQEKIPTQDKNNIMYLNYAGYFFELLKLENDEPAEYGELGRIVVTDFHNYAFPLIRYDTGDVGIMSSPNKYSNGYPVLQKLYGRKLDVCTTTQNKPFSPMAIGRILKHYDKIYQWQFIQKSQTEYHLRLIINNDIDTTLYLATAIIELKKILGEKAIIHIEKVHDIPVLASGKRKAVVNEYKNIQ